mmetsp:Transcript_2354/g.5613  ORF Transcript_2354/g.5613 Transcript_2354/m.5613 type:complete len:271 (-) Transcript_2354:95-907(-)
MSLPISSPLSSFFLRSVIMSCMIGISSSLHFRPFAKLPPSHLNGGAKVPSHRGTTRSRVLSTRDVAPRPIPSTTRIGTTMSSSCTGSNVLRTAPSGSVAMCFSTHHRTSSWMMGKYPSNEALLSAGRNTFLIRVLSGPRGVAERDLRPHRALMFGLSTAVITSSPSSLLHVSPILTPSLPTTLYAVSPKKGERNTLPCLSLHLIHSSQGASHSMFVSAKAKRAIVSTMLLPGMGRSQNIVTFGGSLGPVSLFTMPGRTAAAAAAPNAPTV